MPSTVVAKIVKDGSDRYIQVNMAPDALWNAVLDFWPSVDFKSKEKILAPVLWGTNWAENKANLPQDIIRATLGKILDSVYSTGEKRQIPHPFGKKCSGAEQIFILPTAA